MKFSCYQIGFKKWLNALLTPPAELNTKGDEVPVDVAKLWQACKKMDVLAAPTKEAVSNKYHVNRRLDGLRQTAVLLFTSPKVAEVLKKVVMYVENDKVSIRKDRNVHLDLGLQQTIMQLLLSYNPLWLRIGLETIYGCIIPLHSNADIIGITKFILDKFFKDQHLIKKHKTFLSEHYKIDIKKFILKKFLMLIYFLDVAKKEKIIPHDPCLFNKKAVIKESREIVLAFSRELLAAIGDITRVLKHTGYVLSYKQLYIHEYDYAVNYLGSDLRDGVRLTKIMEVILIRDDLTDQLRVPAISRLQRVHNMKLVFDALQNAGESYILNFYL